MGKRWGQERGWVGQERLWSRVQDPALLEDQSSVIRLDPCPEGWCLPATHQHHPFQSQKSKIERGGKGPFVHFLPVGFGTQASEYPVLWM